MAVWRRDEEAGQSYSLKLTAAGLRAIAVDDGDAQSEESGSAMTSSNEASSNTAQISKAANAAIGTPAINATTDSVMATANGNAGSGATAPREGTKIAQALEFLQRDQGATREEVIAAAGWLPRTSRAALTGLRKRGYGIERRQRTGRRARLISETRKAMRSLSAAIQPELPNSAPPASTAASAVDPTRMQVEIEVLKRLGLASQLVDRSVRDLEEAGPFVGSQIRVNSGETPKNGRPSPMTSGSSLATGRQTESPYATSGGILMKLSIASPPLNLMAASAA